MGGGQVSNGLHCLRDNKRHTRWQRPGATCNSVAPCFYSSRTMAARIARDPEGVQGQSPQCCHNNTIHLLSMAVPTLHCHFKLTLPSIYQPADGCREVTVNKVPG
jgi:hypothetical protein